MRALPHRGAGADCAGRRCRASTLYGLVQKDKPEATRAFLDEVGNPFAASAVTIDGRAAIEWGVYGVPETYRGGWQGRHPLQICRAADADAVAGQQLLPAIEAAQPRGRR